MFGAGRQPKAARVRFGVFTRRPGWGRVPAASLPSHVCPCARRWPPARIAGRPAACSAGTLREFSGCGGRVGAAVAALSPRNRVPRKFRARRGAIRHEARAGAAHERAAEVQERRHARAESRHEMQAARAAARGNERGAMRHEAAAMRHHARGGLARERGHDASVSAAFAAGMAAGVASTSLGAGARYPGVAAPAGPPSYPSAPSYPSGPSYPSAPYPPAHPSPSAPPAYPSAPSTSYPPAYPGGGAYPPAGAASAPAVMPPGEAGRHVFAACMGAPL